MSHESNSISLRKAFERPLKEPRLLGIAFAELGALILAAALLYAVTLRVLMTRFDMPANTLMTYFGAGALPPEGQTIIFLFVGIASIVLSLIVLLIESGLFGAIAGENDFWSSVKKNFLGFLVIAIAFEIFELVALVLYAPAYWVAWWPGIGDFLFFFVALFYFVWRMVAQFTVLKEKSFAAITKSFRDVTKKFGYWGKAVLTLVVMGLVLLLASIALLLAGSLHPAVLIIVVVVLVAAYVYVALAVRIFFFNRIRAQ